MINSAFRPELESDYDFFLSPTLIIHKNLGSTPRWLKTQRTHEGKVLNPASATDERVSAGFSRLNSILPGMITGDVVDIGGGWGVLRQWHDGNGTYVVHDPGLRRILAGPHPSHRQYFAQGFRKPVSFVIGLGEDLPYRSGSFDTAILKEVLDHCEDPDKTVAEAYRVLRPGGRMIILNHMAGRIAPKRSLLRRLVRMAIPRRDHHLHHFTSESFEGIATQAGFELESQAIHPPTHILPEIYAGMWKR